MVVCAVSVGLLVQMCVLSALQQRSAQQRLFDQFRGQLAAQTAPIGPTDIEGRELAIGAPVSYIEIPALGVRQVLVEGTTSGAMLDGPGHRRDSPLPGQAGVSVVLGRRAGFGAPFARLADLDPGSTIVATTGQGTFEYEVVGVRREGDPLPAPVAAGDGRMVLATADGRPFVPNGVLRVDAALTSDAVPGVPRLVSSASLPAAEQLMAGDTSLLWALALWLQVLVVLAAVAVWAWHRWGRAQAWVVFTPPFLLVGMFVSNHAARVLPNLL